MHYQGYYNLKSLKATFQTDLLYISFCSIFSCGILGIFLTRPVACCFAAMVLDDLHVSWEQCDSIRSRFRRELPWLTWPPVPERTKADSDEEDEELKYPICTKSLELNIDAVSIMFDHVDGEFVEISSSKQEASLYSLCWDVLGLTSSV